MKKYAGWDNVQSYGDYETLPVGGYVCRIIGAKVEQFTRKDGELVDRLALMLDVDEGDYKGFFRKDYDAQTGEEKKWRCIAKMFLPMDDGTEQDEWAARRLKTLTNAVEDSNNGFRWAWDEAAFKNKLVGVVFRQEEWAYNGKTGVKVAPYTYKAIAAIREGKYKIPDAKTLEGKRSASVTKDAKNAFGITEDEIPFY